MCDCLGCRNLKIVFRSLSHDFSLGFFNLFPIPSFLPGELPFFLLDNRAFAPAVFEVADLFFQLQPFLLSTAAFCCHRGCALTETFRPMIKALADMITSA